jgi:hypothetical protein
MTRVSGYSGLGATTGSAEFLAGLSTPTWRHTDGRYDAGYPGATLRAARGERVRSSWRTGCQTSIRCTGKEWTIQQCTLLILMRCYPWNP